MSQTTDERADAIRGVIDALNDQDPDALEEYMASDLTIRGATDHDALAEFQAYVEAIYDSFPDYEFEITRILVDGETAAFRTTVTGTHEGEFDGIPPTGEEFEYTASFFAEFDDDEIARLEYDADRVAMLEDLGIMD